MSSIHRLELAAKSAAAASTAGAHQGSRWAGRAYAGVLLLAENRELWSIHVVLFVQRVLRRHQVRRRAPGRFMYQAAEEADAGLHSELDTGVHGILPGLGVAYTPCRRIFNAREGPRERTSRGISIGLWPSDIALTS